MKTVAQWVWALGILIVAFSCSKKNEEAGTGQPVHQDVSYLQDFSKKFELQQEGVGLKKVYSDRNGVIQIYSSAGLLKTYAGEFLYPGLLVPDKTYRPIADKKILNLGLYHDQFVYLDDKAVLSNAWAGNLYSRYTMLGASLFEGGETFSFLISDGHALQYLKDSKVLWEGKSGEKINDIIFDASKNVFWLLSGQSLSFFSVKSLTMTPAFSGNNFACFTLSNGGKEIVIGTNDGYLIVDADSKQQKGEVVKKLPWTEITTVQEINGKLWFGSTRGAFAANADGKFDYYASKRWLPSDNVVDIEKGPDNSVLVLTDKGLGQICFKAMTLHDKAMYFEKQVRARHIRHGFNATLGYMQDGSLATGSLEDSDNDGLWTSMYLGGEVFRYAVTKSEEALQNIEECMAAMERLYTINGVKGFPSRSFERTGYKYEDKPWRRAKDPEWDWKSTTSSDEAIGHIFAFGVMAELLDDQKDLQTRAITLIDSLMQHTIDNDFYLVDWNGEPTLWGKWNPKYVNARPVGVGDRKINSSNIIAMLQTAYHFTKKEVYKEKAFELMTKHGYYENLMFPMSQVRQADANADDWSKMLSESWNHSDDEMYFVGYWGLYRYAFNDTLKVKFKEAILDHWQIERPEKEGAWNIFTALTGTKEFDLNEAVWYLQEYPMDLVHWKVENSHRKDIELMEPNFRRQTIKEVLPASELPISRHNANRFDLDGGDNGASEYSAGDIWLLPYWMGRYLNVISAPDEKKK
ncbi:hypothetical protein [Chryseolinea sp. H1M3-3]|uniref:hypothetical protein n=1 Tax=Chryseolinea sp. H1M3-3 TaxID=3034144 RepID=UPI0023ECEFDC|nr:hypothetical protein [Chryseolinea sp. H1M3-3]